MAAPKTTPPADSTQTSESISATSIADAGADLTRLVVAVIPLPFAAMNAIGSRLPGLISSMTTALGGAASAQGGNDLGKATGDLVNATAGLSLGLLKVAVQGLESAVRAVNTAVTESSAPPSK
ncbi:MAG: hypothetical protein WCJ55_07175 [Chloroflexales bacterium]